MSTNEYIEKQESVDIPKVEKNQAKPKPKKEGKKAGRPNAFAQILNGDFLSKEFVINNLGFIFFVLFLLLLIVGKGYYGKQLTRDVDTAQKDLNEMTSEYVELKAHLEEVTRRYRLVEKLEPKGLKETVNPTRVIRLKKKD
jgi:cell division protein FtsL